MCCRRELKLHRWATWGYIRQTLTPLEVGKSYKLKFYYGLGQTQQVNVPGCKISIRLSSAGVGAEIPLAFQTPGVYTEVERTLVPTVANPLFEVWALCNPALPADIDVLLDNFSIVEDPCVDEPTPTETPTTSSAPATSTTAAPACTNRILNPSFEDGVDGKDHWTLPPGAWVQGIDGAQTAYDGNGYMCVTSCNLPTPKI